MNDLILNNDEEIVKALIYTHGKPLYLLDQRLLPHKIEYVTVKNVSDGWSCIQDMVIRGAPALSIAAALSLAVDLYLCGNGKQFISKEIALTEISSKIEYLITSRPTAVNLPNLMTRLLSIVEKAATEETSTPASIVADVIKASEDMYHEDVASCHHIGDYGVQAIQHHCRDLSNNTHNNADSTDIAAAYNILTHCNAGALATAGYGTALGVIRSLKKKEILNHAFCTETRPYMQGSRLTAFELVHEKIPATLIVDSAASSLLLRAGPRTIDAVIVGADRIAANGDTANKVGTLSLALAAKFACVPFFVAAPVTTIDMNISSGSEIPIEERCAEEITHYCGVHVAADHIGVWNPAFDVTPASLITAIITDKGLIHHDDGQECFDIATFLRN